MKIEELKSKLKKEKGTPKCYYNDKIFLNLPKDTMVDLRSLEMVF